VIESKHKGVTTSIGEYLKLYRITKDTHNTRKARYVKASYNNPNITWSSNTDLLIARLLPRESIRR
jgi:hypothetical protein